MGCKFGGNKSTGHALIYDNIEYYLKYSDKFTLRRAEVLPKTVAKRKGYKEMKRKTIPKKPIAARAKFWHSLEASRPEQLGCDNIWIHIRSRAAVLEVATAIGLRCAWDPHRSSAVGHSIAELVDRSRLMGTCEAPLVPGAVHLDVLHVFLSQLLDCLNNGRIASRSAHRGSRIIRVATCAVPIAGNRLGIEAHIDTLFLANADHQIPRHPHVVAAVDACARADLVLPLSWHHLGVCASDGDARIEAGLVMRLHDGTPEGDIRTGGAIVRALWPWVTAPM